MMFIHQMEVNGNILRKTQNTNNAVHMNVRTVFAQTISIKYKVNKSYVILE